MFSCVYLLSENYFFQKMASGVGRQATGKENSNGCSLSALEKNNCHSIKIT